MNTSRTTDNFTDNIYASHLHKNRGRSIRHLYLDDANNSINNEKFFLDTLHLEKKRVERTGKILLLAIVNIDRVSGISDSARAIDPILSALIPSIRETDVCGWYSYGSQIGIIFTDMDDDSTGTAVDVIVGKMVSELRAHLEPGIFAALSISFHLFPEKHHTSASDIGYLFDPVCHPDITRGTRDKRVSLFFKRLMDLAGGITALILFAPLFLIIPVLIKTTSRGPVLFRQERVGRRGTKFMFLKFRSMYTNNDDSCHRDFIRKFITENKGNNTGGDGGGATVYKIQDDPRVTPLGRILRKTSLDELPQFINVLKGEMSLVGPRPAIPYECHDYDTWHRHRLLSVKPGITGLWQVMGRSSTSFDEMVRLDLRYIREWSLWLDIKLVLLTPWAVLRGKGAY